MIFTCVCTCQQRRVMAGSDRKSSGGISRRQEGVRRGDVRGHVAARETATHLHGRRSDRRESSPRDVRWVPSLRSLRFSRPTSRAARGPRRRSPPPTPPVDDESAASQPTLAAQLRVPPVDAPLQPRLGPSHNRHETYQAEGRHIPRCKRTNQVPPESRSMDPIDAPACALSATE
jgi:hypothetical protein